MEFLGPLGVAVAGSRRLLDGLWVLLAAAGIALLAQPGGTVERWRACCSPCWPPCCLGGVHPVGQEGGG